MDPSPAEVEAAATDLPVAVPLGDDEVEVQPAWAWPAWAVRALSVGDDHLWARACLTVRGWEVWQHLDPTADEADVFLDAWEAATGQRVDDIARMRVILDEYGDELELDLVRWYNGQDLRHLWQPRGGPSRLTWRRLALMYDRLPPESATRTAETNALGEERLAELGRQRRDGFGAWSHVEMRLAAIEDALRSLDYHLLLINTERQHRSRLRPPEPVHRPGIVRKRRRQQTAESRELLRYMREHNGALPPTYRDVDQLPGG